MKGSIFCYSILECTWLLQINWHNLIEAVPVHSMKAYEKLELFFYAFVEDITLAHRTIFSSPTVLSLWLSRIAGIC